MFKNIPSTILHAISAQSTVALRHVTFAKIANLIINQIEYMLRRSKLSSSPLAIKIEPTPLCQLRCPGCLHSDPEHKKQFNMKTMHLAFDNYKKIVDVYAHYAFCISLSLYGEPMLNKEILRMVEYAHSKNIGISFPTNLSLRFSQDEIDKIVKSGLDMLIVALDGASKETYSKYRVGGDFNLVVDNVKRIAEAKKAFNSSTPHVRWKFIVFDYNEHEKDYVVHNYKKLGFDSYVFVNDSGTELKRGNVDKHKAYLLKQKKACFWPWRALVVDWNGEILPCCGGITSHWGIGNISQSEEAGSVWNSDIYISIRRSFHKDGFDSHVYANCRRCYGLEPAPTDKAVKRV